MKKYVNYIKPLLIFLLTVSFLSYSISPVFAATFTPNMAKRDAPGPFAAAPMVQGPKNFVNAVHDVLSSSRGTQISGDFYANHDMSQGSAVLWWTPEFNSSDSDQSYTLFNIPNTVYVWYEPSVGLFRVGFYGSSNTQSYSITPGITYNIVLRWDTKGDFYGTDNLVLSVNDTHYPIDVGTSNYSSSSGDLGIGGYNFASNLPSNGIVEGLTIYRRPLFDGTYGIDVGNGDEIAQIYNSGAGKDPTLITGSWDVVFALPTNSSTGTLTTGTGNAWSHPHSSNLLYTSTTNTGGFMMNGNYATDGWSPYGALATTNGTGNSLSFAALNKSIVVPDSASLKPGDGDWSITMWANPDVNLDKWVPLLSKENTSTAEGYGLWSCNSTATGPGKHICATYTQQYAVPVATRYIVTQQEVIDGNWHHIAVIATKNANSLKLFVDGKEAFVTTYHSGSWPIIDNTDHLYFGNSNFEDYPEYTGRYSKEISEVRIFSRALSQDEIKSTMYKSTLSEDEMDGLVGWWKMNDASGQTVTDSSGNGNNGTLGANASVGADDPTWSTDAPVPSISALATGEKIFAGGYKTTSSAVDAGIVRGVTGQAVGRDYVVRALANSDGTSIPKVVIWDTTNNAEITSLTGTNTSTRTDPDNLIFTFELPTVARNGVATDSTGFEVRLINTQDSGTTYWHQVEVLPNLIDNPSMETGSGDPWIPTGWTNVNLTAGKTEMETSVVHSGAQSMQWNQTATTWYVYQQPGTNINTFAAAGLWSYGGGNAGFDFGSRYCSYYYSLQNSNNNGCIKTPYENSFKHSVAVIRNLVGTGAHIQINSGTGATSERYADDIYFIALNDVSLTVTPASLANSTENGDEIRVDGRDTYTASSGEATSIGTSTGYVSFNYRPRHSAADMVKFAETTSDDAYVMSLAGDGDDYVNLYWDSANTLKMEYSMNGTTASSTWDATSAIAANTEYDLALSYTGGSTMTLAVDGTTRITLSSIPSTFGTAPNTVYFGSNSSGANQGDATFSDLVFDSTAPSISLTALSPDPNNDNTPTLSGTATEAIGTVSNVEY